MNGEEKILSILESMRADFGAMQAEQRGTNERLERLERKVDVFSGEVAGVKHDMAEMKTELAGVKHGVAEMKTELAGVKHGVAEMKTELAGVKHDMAEMKTELAGVKHDVAEMKTELAGVKHDVAEMKTELAGVKHEQTGMRLELAEIKDTLGDVFEHAVRLTEQQTVIERSIKDLNAVTEVNAIDILKLRAAK